MRPAELQDRYDTTLLGIIQHEGDIAKFLDVIFAFLFTRTDFFVHLTPDGKMGFAPGVNKKILLAVYKRYEELAESRRAATRREEEKREAERLERKSRAAAETCEMEVVPDAIQTEEVVSTSVEQVVSPPTKSSSQSACSDIQPNQSASGDIQPNQSASSDIQTNQSGNSSNVSAGLSAEASGAALNKEQVVVPSDTANEGSDRQNNDGGMKEGEGTGTDTTRQTLDGVTNSTQAERKVESDTGRDTSKTSREEGEEGEDSEASRLQKLFQQNSESYNGAVRENYSWSQSITDVDARIKVPAHIKKAKEVSVQIEKQHLRATYKDAAGQTVTAVDDQLKWAVNIEQSMWTLVPTEHIHVNLEKKEERWWDALLESEEKIAVRAIDASRPMSDLDDAAQAKVDELMYNERQKQLGLPQSHESKAHEMLRKAWDVEGSPFKGQPFDPSKINISGNNY